MKKIVRVFSISFIALIMVLSRQTNASAWSSIEHHTLINSGCGVSGITDSNAVALMQLASDFADSNPYCSKQGRLHAAQNYKVTLTYLTNLAHAYYNNEEHPYVYALSRLSAAGQAQMKDTENGTRISVQDCVQQLLLKTQLIAGYNEGSNYAKAYKIMGFVTHVTGDLYAHRTMVPTTALWAFNTGHFKDWNGFVNQVNTAGDNAQFRKIKLYLRDEYAGNNRLYEDNPGFLFTRWDQAETAVKNIVYHFRDYDFGLYLLAYQYNVGEIILHNWNGYIER